MVQFAKDIQQLWCCRLTSFCTLLIRFLLPVKLRSAHAQATKRCSSVDCNDIWCRPRAKSMRSNEVTKQTRKWTLPVLIWAVWQLRPLGTTFIGGLGFEQHAWPKPIDKHFANGISTNQLDRDLWLALKHFLLVTTPVLCVASFQRKDRSGRYKSQLLLQLLFHITSLGTRPGKNICVFIIRFVCGEIKTKKVCFMALTRNANHYKSITQFNQVRLWRK